MHYRIIAAAVLFAACNTAVSQQTQSPGLELNLEQFPEQSAKEQIADDRNNELQLDLKQFDQQQESKDLELNLDQFEGKDTDRGDGGLIQQNSANDESVNKELEINLEQFEKDDSPGTNVSPNANPQGKGAQNESAGTGKINTTGSAATKIGKPESAERDDTIELVKAGLWALAVVIPIFLFLRSRSRKRRRRRAPGPKRRRPTYDEQEHR